MKTAIIATVTALFLLCFTACYQAPPTVIDPVDDPSEAVTTTTEEVLETRPTVALPETRLSMDQLFVLHHPEMLWSDLEGYEHEMTGDSSATFPVSDKYGASCSLNVTYDADSGMLTAADLVFGDVSETILTHSVQGLTRIALLMSEV